MTKYVEFKMPDGSIVVIESSDGTSGIVDAGIGDAAERARESFEEAFDKARKSAQLIREKLRSMHDAPDEIQLTFGLNASGELGNLAIAKAGVTASYSITMKWTKTSTESQTTKKPADSK